MQSPDEDAAFSTAKAPAALLIFALFAAAVPVQGAVVRLDLVASGNEQSFSPGFFIPGLGSFGAQSNNLAIFSVPAAQPIVTSGSTFEFYLMAPAGQLFSFTSDTGQRFGLGLNFLLNDGNGKMVPGCKT